LHKRFVDIGPADRLSGSLSEQDSVVFRVQCWCITVALGNYQLCNFPRSPQFFPE
jgi:hypothetical protein